MADYTITIPQIDSAVLSPNPATINRAVTLAIAVSEVTVTLQPEIWYSGELFAGEV